VNPDVDPKTFLTPVVAAAMPAAAKVEVLRKLRLLRLFDLFCFIIGKYNAFYT
jgi:hypothetical protein